ncbi:hypothetical protein ACFB49_46350 [Sphingomonas sp. DBB INV C78]|uniref:MarR family transcriptional regulator n=1 Tax=Sphingomonas sp. DBB INV C78 TaxID=3349434 RepID=UPI0036D28626
MDKIADYIPHEPVDYRMPSLLAVGDDILLLSDMADAGRGLGLLVETIALDDAGLRRMAEAGPGVTMMLALAAADGPATETALAILRQRADRGMAGLICVPLAAIDRVQAGAEHPGILLLCEPSTTDLAAALAITHAPPPARLNDSGKAASLYPQLQQLSEQMSQIARALASISGEEGGAAASTAAPIPAYAPARWPALEGADGEQPPVRPEGDAAHVRAIIRGRRLRDSYFPADLFADPAWDMLLDLTAARLEGRHVAVSSLCIAAAVPPTTALRWIKTLTEAGTFIRIADPHDGRRVFITLSDPAADAVLNYLAAARRMTCPVV